MGVSSVHAGCRNRLAAFVVVCIAGDISVPCISLVRLALFRCFRSVFQAGVAGEGALLGGGGVLHLGVHLADSGRAVGCHLVVRLGVRDAYCPEQGQVVLVAGGGCGGEFVGQFVENHLVFP